MNENPLLTIADAIWPVAGPLAAIALFIAGWKAVDHDDRVIWRMRLIAWALGAFMLISWISWIGRRS